MEQNREICCCYHVSLGKLIRFTRRTRPVRASQLSECLGAGTGCGWCIPFLREVHAACLEDRTFEVPLSAEEYETRRADYIKSKQTKNRF